MILYTYIFWQHSSHLIKTSVIPFVYLIIYFWWEYLSSTLWEGLNYTIQCYQLFSSCYTLDPQTLLTLSPKVCTKEVDLELEINSSLIYKYPWKDLGAVALEKSYRIRLGSQSMYLMEEREGLLHRVLKLWHLLQETVKRDCQCRELIDSINSNHVKLLIFDWF